MNKNYVLIDSDIKELIPAYLASREKDLKILKESLISMDLNSILEITHKIKGNARTFGFNELEKIVLRVESHIDERKFSLIQIEVDEFENYLKNLEIEYV